MMNAGFYRKEDGPMVLNASALRRKTVKWYVAVPLLLLVAILFAVVLRNQWQRQEQLRK